MLTLLFMLYCVIATIIMILLSVIALVICYPFDPARRVVHFLSKELCMIFWKTPWGWKQDVWGLENIDPSKTYVIAINHKAMVDIASLYFLPLVFKWVSKKEVFMIPGIGQFLLIHGDIPIQRARGAESMKKVITDGKKWISRGASIAIFPEGTRSKDGEIHRFKQGAFILAKEAGVEILPVVIDETQNLFRKGTRLFNWKHNLKLQVLPPVPKEEVAAKDASQLADEVRSRMVEALANMRKN